MYFDRYRYIPSHEKKKTVISYTSLCCLNIKIPTFIMDTFSEYLVQIFIYSASRFITIRLILIAIHRPPIFK